MFDFAILRGPFFKLAGDLSSDLTEIPSEFETFEPEEFAAESLSIANFSCFFCGLRCLVVSLLSEEPSSEMLSKAVFNPFYMFFFAVEPTYYLQESPLSELLDEPSSDILTKADFKFFYFSAVDSFESGHFTSIIGLEGKLFPCNTASGVILILRGVLNYSSVNN